MDYLTRMKLMGGVPVDLSKVQIKESIDSVLQATIKQLDKEAANASSRSQKAMYHGDASDYENILNAYKDGDQKRAKSLYANMDTASRDAIFDTAKGRVRQELAKYFGVSLLKESSCSSENEEEKVESEKVSCPMCKADCSKDEFYSHMTDKHPELGGEEKTPVEDEESYAADSAAGDVSMEITTEETEEGNHANINKQIGDWVARIKGDEAYSIDDVPEELRDEVKQAMCASKNTKIEEATKEADSGAVNATVWDGIADADENPNQAKEETKIEVPKKILVDLDREIKELRAEAEEKKAQRKQEAEFYNHLANAMEYVKGCLIKHTEESLKEAQIFVSSLMSPMIVRFPDSVTKYLATGGKPQSLKGLFNAVNQKGKK